MEHKKEVYFVDYCKTCKHFKLDEDESPCGECLFVPFREDSHKPYYYEEETK